MNREKNQRAASTDDLLARSSQNQMPYNQDLVDEGPQGYNTQREQYEAGTVNRYSAGGIAISIPPPQGSSRKSIGNRVRNTSTGSTTSSKRESSSPLKELAQMREEKAANGKGKYPFGNVEPFQGNYTKSTVEPRPGSQEKYEFDYGDKRVYRSAVQRQEYLRKSIQESSKKKYKHVESAIKEKVRGDR
jgi:hypothetical protein